jgi:DNA-directed RNA polymerase subunit RPC12/RpoP
VSVFSAGHRCPGCGSHRVERGALHGWFERTLLPRIDRHAYRCLECDRRFWDRSQRPPSSEPSAAEAEEEPRGRRRPRWRVEALAETTAYSRNVTVIASRTTLYGPRAPG